MNSAFYIRPVSKEEVPLLTKWARDESFAPGIGDVDIYRNTDKQGVWVGCLNDIPIGCIAGIRYNRNYGFIGLFIVLEEFRGNGYGLKLWKHALKYLSSIPLIGLEAATDRIDDYKKWGFKISSMTTRWKWDSSHEFLVNKLYPDMEIEGYKIISGKSVSSNDVQLYDASKENSPRPHFLADWLEHKMGSVGVLVDNNYFCHGFGRIRPCLLQTGQGWRIGPLLADTPPLAELLLRTLVSKYSGSILIDTPGLNPYARYLLESLGFKEISRTYRMYKGNETPVSLNQVYGLACLELG
tara:strand:+ start:729 stop:1619 length:891 start_codon:yes stop_codon:yes gene_type:complete